MLQKNEMLETPQVHIQRTTTHVHGHFGKNIIRFSMTGGDVVKAAGQNGSREKQGQLYELVDL